MLRRCGVLRRRSVLRRGRMFRWCSMLSRRGVLRRSGVFRGGRVLSRSSMLYRSRVRLSLRFSLWRSSLGFDLWLGLSRRRSMLFHGQRLCGSQVSRMSAIGLGKRCLVGPGRSRVLRLERGRRHMRLVLDRPLGGRGRVLNAVRTAVESHVIGIGDDASLHHRPVDVGGVDDGFIHMHNRGVVGKGAAPPLATGKADAAVAEAVVHAAIEANVVAPVAVMKPILAVVPTPVWGRPQRALIGSRNPTRPAPSSSPHRHLNRPSTPAST